MAKKTMTQKVSVRSELDLYLEGPPVPNSPQFDVLHSWRLDTKFPTLRRVVKDILAIPASSVASESAFSSGGRLISAHRARLHSKTVEALTCLQNWMLEDLSGCRIDNKCAWASCADDEDLEEESDASDLTDAFCLEEEGAYL